MMTAPQRDTSLEIVIPVYNEEVALARSITTLRTCLEAHVPFDWQITIADNASTDRTLQIARLLAADPRVRVMHLGKKGEADVATGSLLRQGAVVTRQWKREVLSRGYNALIAALFRHQFSDAQCGFKALTHRAAQTLLPAVGDDAWFFDTELVLLAEAQGLRIHEVPVARVEDLDRRVAIVPTVVEDLKGLWRLRTRGVTRIHRPLLPPAQDAPLPTAS